MKRIEHSQERRACGVVRDLWKKYNYLGFGIIAEPYLTDTGRRWDDRFGAWVWELVWQHIKNGIKRIKVLGFKI